MKSPPPLTCQQCGAEFEAGGRFCSACGQPITEPGFGKTEEDPSSGNETITWEEDISLLGNPLIIKQSFFVAGGAGLLMAFLMSFLFATTGEYGDILPVLFISAVGAAGLWVFMALIMVIFFGNRIRIRFTVDGKGALWETVDKRALGANRLAMVAGVLGRSPGTAGAGAVAASREKEFVSWTDVKAIEHDPRRHMIVLRSSWRPVMMLVCRPENFGRVNRFLEQRIMTEAEIGAGPVKRKALAKPLAKALLRTVAVTLASTPVFILARHPVELDVLVPLIMFCFALATVWMIPLFGWVVLGATAFLAVQIAWVGWSEVSMMYRWEQVGFFLAYVGLLWLAWFSWGAVRGRFLPPLLED